MQQGLFQFSLPLDELHNHLEYSGTHSIVLMDRCKKIVYCNRVFLESTGYTYDQLQSFQYADVFTDMSPVDCGAIRQTTVRYSSGHEQHTRCCMTTITSKEKEVFLLVSLYDIKPRSELSLLQQFAGTLMQDINLGVILFDTAFKLIDISDMACEVLGFVRTDVVNRPVDEVFHALPEEHQLVPRSVLDGIMIHNQAFSWTNNSERYELLLDSSLLRDEEGRVVGGYLTFKDVTNLRSLEEQVQRSDRLAMIGQIAAGAAHEIRNPLTSIKGFLQMFKNTFIEKEMLKEQNYADIMLMEIDRINELVNEFLLLSKRKNVSYELVDVSHVLREIMPIIQSEAMLHSVVVQDHPAANLPKIIADRELLKQVFLNIGKNGIEAMNDGGILTIQVKVDAAESKLQVVIHDTGPGIPNYVVDKIFDPFFTTKATGTGLGLSVCQRIIHDMGGAIRVSSKGFGTTFTVSIPIP